MAHKEILEELRQLVRDLCEHIPAVCEGHCALNAVAFDAFQECSEK